MNRPKSRDYSDLITSMLRSAKYSQVMFVFCLLYTATALPQLDIADTLRGLIVIGTIPALYTLYKSASAKAFFWLLAFCLFIQVASWLSSLIVIPEYAYSTPRINNLSQLFFFAFIAIWIDKNPTRLIILLCTFITAFTLTAISDIIRSGSLIHAISGNRIDYGMHNAQFTSMLSAIAILALVITSFNLWPKLKPKFKISYKAVIGILLLFLLFSLVASQSRQVWLAILITAITIPVIFANSLGVKKVLSTYIAVTLLLAACMQFDIINKRINQEIPVIKDILSFDTDNIPMTSVGIRINSWIDSIPWIAENPIIGTDRPSIKIMLESSKNSDSYKKFRIGHLHNFYLETIVSYGIIGIIFIITFYSHIIRNVLTQNNQITSILFVSYLIFWAIINCFESYNTKSLGIYAHSIIIASFYQFKSSKPIFAKP